MVVVCGWCVNMCMARCHLRMRTYLCVRIGPSVFKRDEIVCICVVLFGACTVHAPTYIYGICVYVYADTVYADGVEARVPSSTRGSCCWHARVSLRNLLRFDTLHIHFARAVATRICQQQLRSCVPPPH